ncbi:sulfurtransferase [Kineococcus sp. SYSU DK005]|uniref:sulfurtransferase n=1 Tax=Kineococcus sp. SYSU DK005 TaxID=3383126 RepID=UPI003D7E19B9
MDLERAGDREPAAPPEPTPVLVDAPWLAAHRRDVVVLHVDEDASAYHQAHLPGARAVSTYDDLHEPVRRGPASRQHLEQVLSRLGVHADDHLVLYSADSPSHAAYAFWLLRRHGHQRLSLLDGGLRAWRDVGGPVEDHPVVAVTGGYRSRGGDDSIVVGRDELLARYVGAPGPALLLDCRTPAEHAGHVGHPLDVAAERHRVPGHIPGSRNLPSHLVLDGHRFAGREHLQRLFAEHGLRPDSDVVVYCRVADRSSVLWFALAELVGHPRVRHYVGGWAEYGSLVDVPVELD